MRINICYLLLFVLRFINADVIHDVVEEKKQIALRCPHSVKGNMTWSREINGTKLDILTHVGDRAIKHINDPMKRFSTLADKSLFIININVSDSGRYLCNNQSAVDLTVIPSGTKIQNVTENGDISLKCPHKFEGPNVTWSREIAGKQQQLRKRVSTVEKMLNFKKVKRDDFGLYFCYGKAAVYLNVTTTGKSNGGHKKTTQATMTTPRTTLAMIATQTTTRTTAKASITATAEPAAPPSTTVSQLLHSVLVGIGCLIFLIIIITIIYCTWRHRFKSQETETQCHIYEEIPEVRGPQLTNGIQSSVGLDPVYCLASFSGTSNETNPTYSAINYQPQTGSKTDSPYSLIGAKLPSENNKGTSKPNDNTSVLV